MVNLVPQCVKCGSPVSDLSRTRNTTTWRSKTRLLYRQQLDM